MPMRLKTPMPSLDGATEWFNDEGFKPEDLAGHPVLIHFWAVSCHICHEVMDEVVSYVHAYKDHGLKVVGIHMPKQESDLDVGKVKKDIEQYNIVQPVDIDQLEGQMIVATKWLERIEHRLERMEEVRADLLQAITKLQTELEFKSENTDQEKEIIKQLLSKDKSYQENFAQLLEGEKSRKQERFLQIWAILGPVLASVLTSFFARFFV